MQYIQKTKVAMDRTEKIILPLSLIRNTSSKYGNESGIKKIDRMGTSK
jgi:hypothetical protein